jgi:hypothetical protein
LCDSLSWIDERVQIASPGNADGAGAGNPQEVEGVLNSAAAREPDGELYLFPSLVVQGNYSRIGIARVRFNDACDPAGVERLGIALEPEAGYQLWSDGSGGREDLRVTFLEPLRRYLMI